MSKVGPSVMPDVGKPFLLMCVSCQDLHGLMVFNTEPFSPHVNLFW